MALLLRWCGQGAAFSSSGKLSGTRHALLSLFLGVWWEGARIPQATATGPHHSSPWAPFVFPAPGVGPPLGAGGWAPPATFPA